MCALGPAFAPQTVDAPKPLVPKVDPHRAEHMDGPFRSLHLVQHMGEFFLKRDPGRKLTLFVFCLSFLRFLLSCLLTDVMYQEPYPDGRRPGQASQICGLICVFVSASINSRPPMLIIPIIERWIDTNCTQAEKNHTSDWYGPQLLDFSQSFNVSFCRTFFFPHS